jgi:hypothetical protein
MSSISMKGLTPHLEPRVVRLEADMAGLVQGQIELRKDVHEISEQVRQLTVAVTSAQGPRRTDWSLLLGILTFIVSIGLLTIAPLYSQQAQASNLLRDHTALAGHPVSMVETTYLNKQSDQRDRKYEDRMNRIEETHTRELVGLDTKIQREVELALTESKTKIAELDIRLQREIGLITDRADARLTKVEHTLSEMSHDDSVELRQRRLQDDCMKKNAQ